MSPGSDLKCTLPGTTFPPAPSWERLVAEARRAFPGVPIGGGMFSYFTELNRKRPPKGQFDFVGHSGAPIVHAGDDESVMETLQALPSVFHSVRAFAGDTPVLGLPHRRLHAHEPLRRGAGGKPGQHAPGDEPDRPARPRAAGRGLVRGLCRRGGPREASMR